MQSIEKALPGSGRRGRFYASSMSRLGTETAFEVLAKAKALEAQGREIVHLEIGEPDFDDAELHRRRCGRGAQGRRHALRALGRPARGARGLSPTTSRARAA